MTEAQEPAYDDSSTVARQNETQTGSVAEPLVMEAEPFGSGGGLFPWYSRHGETAISVWINRWKFGIHVNNEA